MIGAIIGDIVGSRFEFRNHFSTEFELFTKECSFTDDTICTVAVADALLKGISFEESLLYWCRKYPFPKGAYGRSFARWIKMPFPVPYNSFGNGSAMRVSPVGWFFHSESETLQYATLSAECTHNHPEGIKGACAVAQAIFMLRSGIEKEEVCNIIFQTYSYSNPGTCDSIRRSNTFNETCQVTVPQAIACFLESKDFEHAIRFAVSIGGDSDTIAAITGSMAEACYDIPENIQSAALSYLPSDIISVLSDFNLKEI